jgi:hypothetical protein
MKYPYIIGETSLTVYFDGQPHTLQVGQPHYFSVRDAILEDDWATVERRLNLSKAVEDWGQGDISVKNGVVYYDGDEELSGAVCDKLISLMREGIKDKTPFVNFITNLLANPSKASVDELYDFLDFRELPIDKDGYVIGYKGVANDYYSVNGNTSTKVISGKVRQGHIYNGVGEVIEVERRCVDDNRKKHCSEGLHVGSFDYAKRWGQRLMVVRFNPKDAVSVPDDCECQKLRVCKYEVIGEFDKGYEEPLEEVFYDPEGDYEREYYEDYDYDEPLDYEENDDLNSVW